MHDCTMLVSLMLLNCRFGHFLSIFLERQLFVFLHLLLYSFYSLLVNKTNPQFKLLCHFINTFSKHNVQKSPVRFVILYKMLVWCKHRDLVLTVKSGVSLMSLPKALDSSLG